MPAAASNAIKTYRMMEYVRRFTAEPAAVQQLVLADPGQFFIVAVEQLYPLFTQAVPPSRATGHSLVYVTSGQARMSIGNDSYTVGPHEMLIARAGQVYSFEPGDMNTGFVCHFHDAILLGQAAPADAQVPFDFLHFWGRPVIELPAQTAEFVGQLLHRLLVEYTTHGLTYPAVVRAYLLALLHELNRAHSTDEPAPLTAAAALTNHFKHLVASSLKTTHRVRDYAEWLNISPNHLSKCVRRVTGKSPARWIEESIVLEAKVLLFQSKWSVGEVGAAVGIEDASYFSRLFRKHTGLTPLAFRKRHTPS
ncbi:AraC family transcriptional regulator [Hymenobacter guriensis]|uniref:Helix-turn-helix domain-containing protein n=1 Tax=Hymenobacter guriensis TaxID=2793065 RepID=A0ABS0L663_9BACT|nr:AraC family transcriptional regulator [Hymenobacter guriensis]MBG8555589.1 helix-turn-helix domain-containing protein [Hymenobacter guriensis]